MFGTLLNWYEILFRVKTPEHKQMIVIRKDLKMRLGKSVAQGCHASQLAYINHKNDIRMKRWLRGKFAKICVSVNSLEEYQELAQTARDAGLIVACIQDAGRTEFHGVPTWTAMAIGPDTSEKLNPITEHLKLL